MTMTPLVLCRSDQGDGGWSLHPPGTTDAQLAEGDGIVLAGGTSLWDEGASDWVRPDASDYAEARIMWTLYSPVLREA